MRTKANRRTRKFVWLVPAVALAGLVFPAFDQSAGASGSSRFCQAVTALAGVSGTSQSTLRQAAADFKNVATVSPRQLKKYAQLLAQDELKVA
jgi:hypothetical protein